LQIEYKEGFKYQLVKTVVFQTSLRPPENIVTKFIILRADGMMTIMDGYAWDGATWAVDTKDIMSASLFHDAAFQLFRMGLLNRMFFHEVSEEMRRIALEDGMNEFRANYIYDAVISFGGIFTDPKQERPILTAP